MAALQRAMLQRHGEFARALQAKLARRLEKLEPEEFSPGLVVYDLDVALRVERMAVGIAPTLGKYESLNEPPTPLVYVTYPQRPIASLYMNLLVRTLGNPLAMIWPARGKFMPWIARWNCRCCRRLMTTLTRCFCRAAFRQGTIIAASRRQRPMALRQSSQQTACSIPVARCCRLAE